MHARMKKSGMVLGTLAVGSIVSNSTSPITGAVRGKFTNGTSDWKCSASGRMYCHNAVGKNFRPNRLLLFRASIVLRYTSTVEKICLLLGNTKSDWNFE